MDKREVPAGVFKQKCLAIIDDVAETRREVVITKRGKAVARLVPLQTEAEIEAEILERLRTGEGGMLVSEEDFLEPTSSIAGWNET